MAIRKDDLYKLVDNLNSEDKKAAFDFMQFLVERSQKGKTKFLATYRSIRK